MIESAYYGLCPEMMVSYTVACMPSPTFYRGGTSFAAQKPRRTCVFAFRVACTDEMAEAGTCNEGYCREYLGTQVAATGKEEKIQLQFDPKRATSGIPPAWGAVQAVTACRLGISCQPQVMPRPGNRAQTIPEDPGYDFAYEQQRKESQHEYLELNYCIEKPALRIGGFHGSLVLAAE